MISKEEIRKSLEAVRKTNRFISLTTTTKPVKIVVTKSKYRI